MTTNPFAASDVAIIGLACRVPGADDPDQFWANLSAGREAISFFSDDDLRGSVPDALLRNPSYVKARGILRGVEEFDAAFFGFNDREAQLMDPQHRFFFECAWKALEDAGHKPSSSPLRIGLFASASTNSYVMNQLEQFRELLSHATNLPVVLGNERDFMPSRVAYKLDLRGPVVNVQTACSSSLVAVHMACQNLLNYECDLALAGGVSIAIPHRAGYLHDSGGISSPDGHCRAFDRGARGCVGGSGVGIVVLRRLDEALQDGDCIRAIVKGSAVNNDGSARVGYTAPGIRGQSQVIVDALAVAKCSADTISYVEAHGTGTSLGDPIEVSALTEAFRRTTRRTNFCGLGSVKTNIGHLDAASGVTGLIKTVLALQHRSIPASLHFQTPNPELHLETSPFYVPTALLPWDPQAGVRRAGVSSFGIGGTNAHVILEEAPRPPEAHENPGKELFVLSARTPSTLSSQVQQFSEHLKSAPANLSLADVAYTLQTGRESFPWRQFVVSSDPKETVELLQGARLHGRKASARPPEVAFLFAGQASQKVGMAQGLYQCNEVFRRTVDECCEILRDLLEHDLRQILWPPEASRKHAEVLIEQTSLAQPAIFVVDYAIACMWMALGVRPSVVLGHSLGEYVAACVSGLIELRDALCLVVQRGRLMNALPGGKMIAVAMPEKELLPLLGQDLSLAGVNGPELCTVAGSAEACDKLECSLVPRAIRVRPLRTSHAFHSRDMDSILEPFSEAVSRTKFRTSSSRHISTLTGNWISPGELCQTQYWVQQLRRTVRFSEALHTLFLSDCGVAIEMGPGNVLSGLAMQHPALRPEQLLTSTLSPTVQQESDVHSLLNAIGRVWSAGVEIDWKALHSDRRRLRVPLPTYPFERKQYWVNSQTQVKADRVPKDAVREPRISASGGGTVLSAESMGSLVDQQIQLLEKQLAILNQR